MFHLRNAMNVVGFALRGVGNQGRSVVLGETAKRNKHDTYNKSYVEAMFESWLKDRASVHKTWDIFFKMVTRERLFGDKAPPLMAQSNEPVMPQPKDDAKKREYPATKTDKLQITGSSQASKTDKSQITGSSQTSKTDKSQITGSSQASKTAPTSTNTEKPATSTNDFRPVPKTSVSSSVNATRDLDSQKKAQPSSQERQSETESPENGSTGISPPQTGSNRDSKQTPPREIPTSSEYEGQANINPTKKSQTALKDEKSKELKNTQQSTMADGQPIARNEQMNFSKRSGEKKQDKPYAIIDETKQSDIADLPVNIGVKVVVNLVVDNISDTNINKHLKSSTEITQNTPTTKNFDSSKSNQSNLEVKDVKSIPFLPKNKSTEPPNSTEKTDEKQTLTISKNTKSEKGKT